MSNRNNKKSSKPSTKRGKLNPNRFQQDQTSDDGLGMFAFDPIRKNVFLWGLGSGIIGGILTLRASPFLQIIIVLGIVSICSYQIAKASLKIPRTHATMMAILGLAVAIFAGSLINALILSYL